MIVLTVEERTKLADLNKIMNETPIVLLFGKHDLHESAKQAVIDYWDELGRKYEFDPKKVKNINTETGEVNL